jgi:pimeloyl-ACP methyl ester carboxylesterase
VSRPIQRGTAGRLPYAAIGEGSALIVIAGLSPTTGVAGDRMVRMTLAPFAALADRRQVVMLNRRPHLPRGITFAELAAEHAEAIRARFGGRADVVGVSTGGSIAQQLAADHPDVVQRLVLASTGCRLEADTKALQRRVAARVRAGAPRRALAVLAAELVPRWRGRIPLAVVTLACGPHMLAHPWDLDDMATTIEAEDTFDLATCPTIRAPTLIFAGGRDRFYSRALLQQTEALIPGSHLTVVDRRGHITALSDGRFGAALDHFLG